MYLTMKCVGTDYLEKSVEILFIVDYSLFWFRDPCLEPRSQFGVKLTRITFTISWSFLLLLRYTSESGSTGKVLVRSIGCVELVRLNSLLGKVTKPSSRHGKEKNRGKVVFILCP